MLSLDNAYNDEELRAFDERVRKGAGLGRGAGGLRRGDEDRRPEHRADLRGRQPRRAARHAATARAARTSRPTCGRFARFRSRCATVPAERIEVRGEVYLPRASFERMNREREERAETPFCEPPKRGRRHDAQSGSGARGQDAGSPPSSTSRSAQTPPLRTARVALARAPLRPRSRRWGLPVEPHWRRCDGIDAGRRVLRGMGRTSGARCHFDTDGVVDQGGRPRAARATRRDRQVPAVGNRVQVPARAGDDDC